METKIDWTSFKRRIHIDKSKEEIFQAWATQKRLETWFLEKAEFVGSDGKNRDKEQPCEAGDSFSWKWHNWPHFEEGKILESNGVDRLVFTFGPGGEVLLELKDSPWGVEVALTQYQIATDEKSKMDYYVSCHGGWTFWMANLKAWLEHGVTLHIKGLPQEEISNLVNS
jgi:uncharacterized protein YndB with AHSA1/START domain